MGRGKIEIKKIENANSRQVTFSKRRSGLFKKARELAILCEAEVAVIIFSNTGKLFEYSSSSTTKILSRYKECLETTRVTAGEHKPEKQLLMEVDALKEEIEKLRLKQLRMLGKDLSGVGLQELRVLEQQMNEGLLCIKERKEELLVEQLTQSKMREQRALLENETLRRQVEELQAFFPPTVYKTSLCIEYHSSAEKSDDPLIKDASGIPELACNDTADDDHSDTTLHLGPPSGICQKRKTPDGSSN